MSSGPFYNEGLHIGQIVGQALSKASTGNFQVVLGVKILGLPNEDGSYNPHRVTYTRTIYLTITEKTIEYLVPKMEAIGFNGSSWGQIDPAHPQCINLVGQQIDLWCRHESGNDNQVREKWDISTGPKELQVTALTKPELRQLDSLFGKALKSKPAPTQGAAQGSVKRNPPPATTKSDLPPADEYDDPGIMDQDIPF